MEVLLSSMDQQPATSAMPRKQQARGIVSSNGVKSMSDRLSQVVVPYSSRDVSTKDFLATVTTCLISCERCSGSYLDTIKGKYLIRCSCSCHRLKSSQNMSLTTVLTDGK